MVHTKSRKLSKDVINHAGVLVLVSSIIFCIFITSCGRRADPVFVPSYEEKPGTADILKDAGAQEETGEEAGKPVAVTGAEEERKIETAQPEAPSGLTAVFTGKGIVLTWREILNQGVSSYRIYRSLDNEFTLAGETVSPAFTDRDITSGLTYSYKVTAVGQSESPASEEIKISAEIPTHEK